MCMRATLKEMHNGVTAGSQMWSMQWKRTVVNARLTVTARCLDSFFPYDYEEVVIFRGRSSKKRTPRNEVHKVPISNQECTKI